MEGEQGIRSAFHERSGVVFFQDTAVAYDAADRSAFLLASLFQAHAWTAAVLVNELDPRTLECAADR